MNVRNEGERKRERMGAHILICRIIEHTGLKLFIPENTADYLHSMHNGLILLLLFSTSIRPPVTSELNLSRSTIYFGNKATSEDLFGSGHIKMFG